MPSSCVDFLSISSVIFESREDLPGEFLPTFKSVSNPHFLKPFSKKSRSYILDFSRILGRDLFLEV